MFAGTLVQKIFKYIKYICLIGNICFFAKIPKVRLFGKNSGMFCAKYTKNEHIVGFCFLIFYVNYSHYYNLIITIFTEISQLKFFTLRLNYLIRHFA